MKIDLCQTYALMRDNDRVLLFFLNTLSNRVRIQQADKNTGTLSRGENVLVIPPLPHSKS